MDRTIKVEGEQQKIVSSDDAVKNKILAILGGVDFFSGQFCEHTDIVTHPATIAARNWTFDVKAFWHWLKPLTKQPPKEKIEEQTKIDDSRM